MSKVQVLGPRRLLPETIRCLHAAGVLQLRSLPEPGSAREAHAGVSVRKIPLAGDELGRERRLEDLSRRLHALLLILPSPPHDARAGDDALPDVDSTQFDAALAAVESRVHALDERRQSLLEERELVSRYERLLTALMPLLPPLAGATHVATVGILVRRDRKDALPLLSQELHRITRGAYSLQSREVDKQHAGVLLTVPRESAPQLGQLLFEQGISEIKLPERYSEQPLVATLSLLLRRRREIPVELGAAEAELGSASRRLGPGVRLALRSTLARLAALRALASCAETEHAFVIWGWVPSASCPALAADLERSFSGKVALLEHEIRREELAEVPVVLHNPAIVRPFELLLSLLAPPRYGSVDPTPFLAGFFPLFFGLMLGDAGYAAVLLALAILARRKGWGDAAGRSATTIAIASSLSAIAFGLLFGEVFGDLGTRLGLRPLLFNRAEAVPAFLLLALAIGVGHVTIGLVLGLWTALRLGEWRRSVAKAATLAVMLAALVAALAGLGKAPAALAAPALVALGPLLVALVVGEGLLAPLEIMKTFGNVFSYARLMALGVASVMLAEVANQMAALFPLVLGVAMAVLLHAMNLAMGCFSPAIQALRLHYVEFFDKFYEDGGRPYEPFALGR